MPFYRQVAGVRQERPAGITFSALSTESAEVVKPYLAKQQVAVDGVYKLSTHIPGLSATPTLLIVDQKGIVRTVFVGKLDESLSQQVLGILRAGAL